MDGCGLAPSLLGVTLITSVLHRFSVFFKLDCLINVGLGLVYVLLVSAGFLFFISHFVFYSVLLRFSLCFTQN